MKKSAYETWMAEGRAFGKYKDLQMGRSYEQIEQAALRFAESRGWCAHPDIIKRAFREGYKETYKLNGAL